MKIVCANIFAFISIVLSSAVFAQTNDMVECAHKAITIAGLTSEQAVKLCVNGGTAQTVDCASRAMKDVPLMADQAVELCASRALQLENRVKFVK